MAPSPRRTFIAFFFASILSGTACRRRRNAGQNLDRPDPVLGLASVVRTNNPRTSSQLISGFYDVEGNAWRWTARRFSVLLPVPKTAAQKGALVTGSFIVSDSILRANGIVAITASIDGIELKTAEFREPGPYVLGIAIPPSIALTVPSVKVDFTLDKSLPPGVDKRELGIIVVSIAIALD